MSHLIEDYIKNEIKERKRMILNTNDIRQVLKEKAIILNILIFRIILLME